MANKEKIDYLLLDIKELEKLIAGMRDAEVYPVSFFSQTFNLTHKILNDLHSLETAQIDMLREQMEAHQALIQSLPNPVAAPMPVAPTVQEEPVQENISEEPELITSPEKPIEVLHIPTPAEKQSIFLNDILEKKNLSDFRKAFSLNDRFRFRRELFGGNEEKMNQAITDLNELQSYEESVSYLNNELKWNIEDEAVADFIKLLEKRFL